jgi:hypothetical protein
MAKPKDLAADALAIEHARRGFAQVLAGLSAWVRSFLLERIPTPLRF